MLAKTKKASPRASSHVDIAMGEKIRTRRLLDGKSQDWLGKALGVSFQQIQKYEKGVNRVSFARLEEIAKALGESPTYFMSNGGGNGTISKAGQELQSLMTDPLNQRMLRAFAALEDKALRYKLVGLAERVGENAK